MKVWFLEKPNNLENARLNGMHVCVSVTASVGVHVQK